MVVRLTLAALATPSMVSPGKPTRASSAMVAARTFSTTWWLRGPCCTPLVRRVGLSIATTLTQMASIRCHLWICGLALCRQAVGEVCRFHARALFRWRKGRCRAQLRDGGRGPNEAGEQRAHLDVGSLGCHDGVTRSEGAQLFLVVGLHDAEPPRASPIEYGAEDHHLPGFDQRLPVRGVTGHDLALFFGHVEREGCARRL